MLKFILEVLFQSAEHVDEKRTNGPKTEWIRIRMAQKHADPDPVPDPDPQHR